jgi:hypothetical protein
MKRLDLYKAKLKTAKAELRIRERDANAATRALMRVRATITELENKIERYLAQPE